MFDTDNPLLKELAEAEGYDDVMVMLEAATFDSIAPGICTDNSCRGTQDCEPDATANWCEVCEQNTVKSCLVIAGII
tara:strand:- start:357 stop:587 length:231 start_codon:yes stop_codon:yes gene_type:complete